MPPADRSAMDRGDAIVHGECRAAARLAPIRSRRTVVPSHALQRGHLRVGCPRLPLWRQDSTNPPVVNRAPYTRLFDATLARGAGPAIVSPELIRRVWRRKGLLEGEGIGRRAERVQCLEAPLGLLDGRDGPAR